MPKNATIFIVDDDAAVRAALSFQLRTVGYLTKTYASAPAFLEQYDVQMHGCLLLDIQMPSMTGLELLREINRLGWSIPAIFITAHGTIPLAIEAIRCGAFEFIEKPPREEVLLDCLRRALDEDASTQKKRLLHAELTNRAAQLTLREREILALVAIGESSKAIARKLGISFRTVEVHRSNITQKLQARGPGDLIRLASAISASRIV